MRIRVGTRKVPIPPLFILGVIGLIAVAIADTLLNPYIVSVISFIFLYMMLAVSLNITNGFTGLFSLGHPAFMGIGGYTAALLVFPAARKIHLLPNLPQWLSVQQWPFFPAILIGGLFAALVAFIIGYPVLRLKGHYLGVATIGTIFIMRVVFRNAEQFTRGSLGLNGIPFKSSIWWIYLFLVITVYVAWKIKFSSFGRALFAMRENEMAASSLGINVTSMKMIAFVVGAFFAGISGGLWAHLTTVITPDSFSVGLAFNIVVMVVIGGSGSITGSLVAAGGISLLIEYLRPLEEMLGLYGLGQIIISIALLLVLIFRVRGLFGTSEPKLLRNNSQRDIS
ncbi:MAG: branched-chain amino acid ABC transporter permease [Sphaerochaetaceae bacterium]|jgi:branched-chain amino acid transport system permease protein